MSATEIERVVGLIDAMVARDGGSVSVLVYDPFARSLRVAYAAKANPDCDTCSFSPEMVEAFLAESLRSHDLQVDELVVSAS